MSINNRNDANVFDPAFRIKQGLDKSFIDEVEHEAETMFRKVSDTKTSSAKITNSDKKYEMFEVNDGSNPEDLLKNIKLNPNLKPDDFDSLKANNKVSELKNQFTEIVDDRMKDRKEIEKRADNIFNIEHAFYLRNNKHRARRKKMEGKNLFQRYGEDVINIATGFSLERGKKYNTANAINLGMRSMAGLAINNVVEASFKTEDPKTFIPATVAATAVDAVISGVFSVNPEDITQSFPEHVVNNMMTKEYEIVKKEIRKQKIIYATEHAVAGVVLPAIAKGVLDKVVPEKYKDNIIYKSLASFGTLSFAGKAVLSGVRYYKAKALYDKVTSQTIDKNENIVTNYDKKPLVNRYKAVANLAVRESIDKKLDPTMIPGLIGSIVGYKSVTIDPGVTMSEDEIMNMKPEDMKNLINRLNNGAYEKAIEEMAPMYDEEESLKDAHLNPNPTLKTPKERFAELTKHMTAFVTSGNNKGPIIATNPETGEEYIPSVEQFNAYAKRQQEILDSAKAKGLNNDKMLEEAKEEVTKNVIDLIEEVKDTVRKEGLPVEEPPKKIKKEKDTKKKK